VGDFHFERGGCGIHKKENRTRGIGNWQGKQGLQGGSRAPAKTCGKIREKKDKLKRRTELCSGTRSQAGDGRENLSRERRGQSLVITYKLSSFDQKLEGEEKSRLKGRGVLQEVTEEGF